MILLLSAPLIDPFSWYRVDDPDYPGAWVRSETGAVVVGEPPTGVPYRSEIFAETDRWVAEEGLQATNTDRWQARGFGGAGVRVAVMDIGFYAPDAMPSEVEPFQTRDCLLHASCEVEMDLYRPREDMDSGVHGFACAEIVRDFAPDAELYLVRTSGFTAFENATRWAIREKIDLISLSLSFYNATFSDGTGPFTPLLADLAAAGTLVVTSAGNDAEGHWFGGWRDEDHDGRHDLDGDNGLWVYADQGSLTAYLMWNQFGRCGDTDLDLRLVDPSTEPRTLLGRAEAIQAPEVEECEPIERLKGTVPASGWYRLEVEHRGGALADLEIDLNVRNGVLEQTMPGGAIVEPGTQALAFTVGAVRAQGYLTNDIEGFSSQGPTLAGLDKPDIAGPNGLSTHAFGPVGFFGTSASAPAVTGMLAVMMSEEPGLTSFEAAERLKLQAWGNPTELVGQRDPRWGHGKARLPVLPAWFPEQPPCGERPLLLPLLAFPIWWGRRRRGRALDEAARQGLG